MKEHAKQFWVLRSKNRMMIELIQEVLASEDGDDIDWDSWDARAKEALRANGVTISEISNKLRKERERRAEQEKLDKTVASAKRQREEFEKAMVAFAAGGETSVYFRSLRRSAELRRKAEADVKTQETA